MWISRGTQSQAVSYLIAAIVRSPRKGADSARTVPSWSQPRPIGAVLTDTWPITVPSGATDRLDGGKESNENATSANGAATFSDDARTWRPRGLFSRCPPPPEPPRENVPILNKGATRSRSETWKIGGHTRKNTDPREEGGWGGGDGGRCRMDPTNRDTEGWVQSGLRGMGRERRPGRLEYRGRGWEWKSNITKRRSHYLKLSLSLALPRHTFRRCCTPHRAAPCNHPRFRPLIQRRIRKAHCHTPRNVGWIIRICAKHRLPVRFWHVLTCAKDWEKRERFS